MRIKRSIHEFEKIRCSDEVIFHHDHSIPVLNDS